MGLQPVSYQGYRWIKYKLRYINKYIPWYHLQFRFQCMKQSMNQFIKTQRSITSIGYDELRWTTPSNSHLFIFFRYLTSFHKPSRVYVLWLLFCAFSWVCWRYLRKRTIWYLWSWGRLIFLIDRKISINA
jgi:hypothetical protein